MKYPANITELRKMVPKLSGTVKDFINRGQQLDNLYRQFDKNPTRRNWVRYCKRALMEN
jgi:hypothetical protein